MKLTKIFIGALLVAIILIPNSLTAEQGTNWPQQIKLTPENTSIEYLVETTFHDVHGHSKNFSGQISLTEQAGENSMTGQIEIPVSSLDSDNASRDETMREKMAAERYPNISFKLTGTKNLCRLSELSTTTPSCSFEGHGELTIRDVTKEIALNCEAELLENQIKVTGKTKLNWSEFGVEDPSFLIAQVEEEMSVMFKITLQAK